jgi:hypothetical protein
LLSNFVGGHGRQVSDIHRLKLFNLTKGAKEKKNSKRKDKRRKDDGEWKKEDKID